MLSMKKSTELTTSSVCTSCDRTKTELNNLQILCNQLQVKYDYLEKQKSTISSASVRVLSTSCTECTRVKS